MDDVKIAYQEDLKRKSQTAKSSHARPHRGKYMRTPSDYMSKKEIAAMNSEPVSYKVIPMRWPDFMKMPDDIQRHYFETIIKRFGMNVSRFAVMFDTSVKTVSNRLKALKIKNPESKNFNLDAWMEWLNAKHEDEFIIVPISYEEFCNLTDEHKKEWLEFVMNKFGIQGLDFGKIFGVNSYTFRSRMYKKWNVHSGKKNLQKRDWTSFSEWMHDGGIDIPNEKDAFESGIEKVKEAVNDFNNELISNIPSVNNETTEVVSKVDEYGELIAGRYHWENEIPEEKDEFEELGRFLKYVKSIGGSVSISITI